MASEDDIRPVDPPEALRALDDVVAPDRLRIAVAERAAGARRDDGRLRRRLVSVLAAAGALAAVLAVLGLFADRILVDEPAGPGVRAVAPVALRAPTAPAPAARPGGELLAAKAGPIAFPTWTRAGWRAVGARSDTVRGHDVRTVFYVDGSGRRIGYAIADAPLPVSGGEAVTRRGAQLRVLARGATAIVTWRRAGRTCILAGRGVPVERLLALASYAA
ncbi:MAG TPA: hypothetical protein VFS37_11410 [Conexibacter sp.]|nr:hypothetical protein [Conexibacter sp.]